MTVLRSATHRGRLTTSLRSILLVAGILISISIAVVTLRTNAEAHSDPYWPSVPFSPSNPIVYDSAPTMGGTSVSHAVSSWKSATGNDVSPAIGSYGAHSILVDEGAYGGFYWGFADTYDGATQCSSGGFWLNNGCLGSDYAVIFLDTDADDNENLTTSQKKWLVAHEMGHVWALKHFPSSSELMYGVWSSGISISPGSHEASHIAQAYP